jgi:endonuclease/exonuclease/phosphatase family metal-dependent hydrolase
MKIFSLNCWIHYLCWTPGNKQERWDKIAQFVECLHADVLCFQEVFELFFFHHKLRGVNVDSKEYHAHKPSSDVPFSRLLGLHQNGGCMTWCKPTKSVDVKSEYEVFTDYSLFEQYSNKGFLVTLVHDLVIINTHMDAKHATVRRKQGEQIIRRLKRHNTVKFVVIGDLNVDSKAEFEQLRDMFCELDDPGCTIYPSSSTSTHINGGCYDKIITNLSITAAQVLQLPGQVTDHFGLMIDLDFLFY